MLKLKKMKKLMLNIAIFTLAFQSTPAIASPGGNSGVSVNGTVGNCYNSCVETEKAKIDSQCQQEAQQKMRPNVTGCFGKRNPGEQCVDMIKRVCIEQAPKDFEKKCQELCKGNNSGASDNAQGSLMDHQKEREEGGIMGSDSLELEE